jgi:hypothetical protein
MAKFRLKKLSAGFDSNGQAWTGAQLDNMRSEVRDLIVNGIDLSVIHPDWNTLGYSAKCEVFGIPTQPPRVQASQPGRPHRPAHHPGDGLRRRRRRGRLLAGEGRAEAVRRALLIIALTYSVTLLASCQPSEAPNKVPVTTTTIDCSVPCALPPLTVER